jgi:CheY-like chemotaxis protein
MTDLPMHNQNTRAVSLGGEWSTTRRELNPRARTALVVDDRSSIRRAVTRLVTAVDKEVVVYHAHHGSDALNRLKEMRIRHVYEPSLMVVDLEMPGMNGWQLIDHLKKDYLSLGRSSGIPIIAFSGTDGSDGVPLFGKTIHNGRYQPLISVAKYDCVDTENYDAEGDQGLVTWLEHFLQPGRVGRTPSSPCAGSRILLKGVH